jgi:hypothetical protein
VALASGGGCGYGKMMHFLDQLEKRFGKWTFPYLLAALLTSQAMVYVAVFTGVVRMDQLLLNAPKVLSGDVWRVLTFMAVPMADSPLWFAIGLYVTYLIGSSLEREWGEFRFGLFLGLGWLCTVAASFVIPGAFVSNTFIMGTLTLAFARLFPDVEFLLFFVVPVKVKYIGWVLWGYYLLELVAGPLPTKIQVLAAIVPFVVFFGAEILGGVKQKRRSASFKQQEKKDAETPFHQCSLCSRNDLTDPDLAFRYEDGVCVCEMCLNERSSVS